MDDELHALPRHGDPDKQEDVVMVCVTANGTEILMDKPMREILGVNIYTWATGR